MGFKKHNWMQFGSQEILIEISLKDTSGAKIDFFRCNNKKDYSKIIRIIEKKYGLSPKELEQTNPHI